MPPPAVRITLRPSAIHHATRSPSGEVGRFLRGELTAIEVGAKARCPVDEGELRASSRIDIRRSGRGLEGEVIFDARHAIFVHEGTRPHWPPVDALVGWARRHGIPSPYLVARAIAQHGTRAVPFLWDSARARLPRSTRRRS